MAGLRAMQGHDLGPWRHDHQYHGSGAAKGRRRTLQVVILTLVVMLLELWAGWVTGSMALLADAWHMASHVAALGITLFAYRFAADHARNRRFTFGTGKVSALGGYTSAVVLAVVAVGMALESARRLADPVPVDYGMALLVAWIGLAVNLAGAWLLHDAHHHDEGQRHDHDHHQEAPQDHNLRGAFLHVVADALTSLLAIVALTLGARLGWGLLDPLMGIVGAALILHWSVGLLRQSGATLLDAEDHGGLEARVIELLEAEPDHRVTDLHLWRIGPSSRACIVSLLSHDPLPVEYYKERLATIEGLDHVTVEVNRCTRCPRGQ
jgi:cation diffusion facilitator family transporter